MPQGRKFNMPQVVANNQGTMKVRKGKNDNEDMMLAWDPVTDCRGEECPANHQCPYLERFLNGDFKKCQVMAIYLRSVVQMIYTNYPNLSEPEWTRVGLHLMPMYRTLCRLKIQELGVIEIMRTNKQGNQSVHAVLEGMTKTILAIDQLWSRMGLDKKYKQKGRKGNPAPPDVDDILTGDPEYYEKMSNNE